MAEKDKRYYWLKLKRDFFKRHDIRIIESMPNGKDYILFYLKLLCESVDHEGNLRFSDEIPYNEDMLSVITNTNVDIVRAAIKLFASLNMIEIMDDGTFYMSKVEELVGSESYWAEKKRLQRVNAPLLDNVQHVSNECPTCPSKSKNKSKNKSKSIDISLISDEFIRLWSIYPRKLGKQKAFDYYKRWRKQGTTFEEVESGIKAYADYIKRKKIEEKYIKQGSTFFSQKAWQDDWGETQGTNVLTDYDDLDGIL